MEPTQACVSCGSYDTETHYERCNPALTYAIRLQNKCRYIRWGLAEPYPGWRDHPEVSEVVNAPLNKAIR